MISGRRHGLEVRAFFALDLPPPARDACAALASRLRRAPDGEGVRWTRPGAYHLTLRFLGNVDTASVPELAKCVADRVAGVAPFAVQLGAAGLFPSARRPRIVAVALEPEAPLAALAGAVEAGVIAAGLPPERRSFRAHLTLGRVRARRVPALDGAAVPGAPELPAREVVLYRSDPAPEGSAYTALEHIPLGGQPAGASPDSP